MRELRYDACVVGGGPAGAVAALGLARFGHRVCLLERQSFPRKQVGESLSPGIWPLLDSLGLQSVFAGASFRAPGDTLLCWAESQPQRISSGVKGAGLLVDRAQFDLMLMQAARQAGVCIIQPARAQVRRASEGWRVETDAGEPASISARFLIDAAGRKGCLPGSRVPFAPKTLALWANLETQSGSATRIEAIPHGWLWAAPICRRRLSLMLFCDAGYVRRTATRDLEQLLRETLGGTMLFSDRAEARLLDSIVVRDATCAYASEIIGADYVKIGEANYSLDPLSSTGVEKAIQTALVGAIAVNTLLRNPERAGLCARFYQARQQEAVVTHAVWSRGYYREVERYAENPFWAARRAVPDSSLPPAPRVLKSTGAPDPATRVRLAPEVSLVEEPCIVGETIGMRAALRSPAFSRPLVFLDEIEVAPLLADAANSPTWKDLLLHWSERLPPARAQRLAIWFWEKRVLCEAPDSDALFCQQRRERRDINTEATTNPVHELNATFASPEAIRGVPPPLPKM